MIRGAAVVLALRRSYSGACGGGVSVSDLWRRSYIGVCRGGVGVSDLRRRSCIGVCRGSAAPAPVWMICSVAVILAFAEEVAV